MSLLISNDYVTNLTLTWKVIFECETAKKTGEEFSETTNIDSLQFPDHIKLILELVGDSCTDKRS